MGQVPEDTWDDELPMLMMAYRSSAQETAKFTPFQQMFAGFYLGIFVSGGSSGEGTARDTRLAGVWVFSPEKF